MVNPKEFTTVNAEMPSSFSSANSCGLPSVEILSSEEWDFRSDRIANVKKLKGFTKNRTTLEVKAGEVMADKGANRDLRATRVEFSKRGIEIGRADIRISHGTLHIGGSLSMMRGAAAVDLKSEVELIGRILRQRPDIKNVVIDCQYREQ